MKPLPLARLLVDHRAPHAPVASSCGAGETGASETIVVQWSHFQSRVAGITAALAQRPERRWALYHSDTYVFATALFALLHAGKSVLLPGNRQPGTVAVVESEVDALLGEFQPGATRPLLDPAQMAAGQDWVTEPIAANAQIRLLTSGSSGLPKIVDKSLAQFDAEIGDQEALWGERLGAAQILGTVSHQHIYGLLFRVLWPLAAGRVFSADTAAYLETLFEQARSRDRCALVCSPAHLKRLSPTLPLADLCERVARVFSSGGPLAASAAAQWTEALGQAPLEVLGSTETGGIAWRAQPQPWRPLPSVHCTIDGDGLLSVRSPFIADAEPVATGDCARWLADGDFELLGRSDDIVKIEEKRVALRELDRHLAQHPWIDDARTLLIPGSRVQLGAVVVLNAQGVAALNATSKHRFDRLLREHLAQFHEAAALPRKWRYVEALPENTQGKIGRDELLGCFESRSQAAQLLPGAVVHAAENELHIVFDLQPTDAVFAGHFPQIPILPAVVQVGWVIGHAQHRWYADDAFAAIEQLKCSEPVLPGRPLRTHIVNLGDGAVKFTSTVEARTVARGRINFARHDQS